MAHRTEGPDFVTSGGKRLYDDAAQTVANANSLNMHQEEICNAVVAAGLTLKTTGALDAADGFIQLTQAIRLLGQMNPPYDHTVTATFDQAITGPAIDFSSLRLVKGASDYPDQTLAMPEVTGYLGRIFRVYNDTPSRKFLNIYDGVVPIPSRHSVLLYGVRHTVTTPDDSVRWEPLGAKILRPIQLKLFDASYNECDAGAVWGFWWTDGAIVYLHVPKMDARISTTPISVDYTEYMFLAIADGGAFPFFEFGNLAIPADSFSTLVHANAGNSDTLMSLFCAADGATPSGYDRVFGLRPFPALTAVDIHTINCQVLQIPIFDNPVP